MSGGSGIKTSANGNNYYSEEELDYVEPEYRMMPSDDPLSEESSSGFGAIGEEDDFEEVKTP